MRKLVFVVIALLLAAVVWMFAPVRSSVLATAPAPGSSATDLQTHPLADSQVVNQSDASSSTLVLSTRSAIEGPEPTTVAPEVTGTNGCALRVIVRFDRTEEFVPDQLDIYLFDPLGQPRDFDRQGNNTFLFSELATGTYLLDVRENSSAPTTMRVKLDVAGEVRTVDIVMAPLRPIAIHWRTPEGLPFLQAVVDPSRKPHRSVMEICASHRPLRQDTAEKSSATFAFKVITIDPDSTFDESTGLISSGGSGYEEPGTKFDDAFDPSQPDRFCRLCIDAEYELWLSVWCDGILCGSQHIAEDQTRVVFTTSLDVLGSSGVPVSLRFVDDKTGQPVTRARIDTDRELGGIEPDDRGSCHFDLPPGWTILDVDCQPDAEGWVDGLRFAKDKDPEARRNWMDKAPSRLARTRLRVFARKGEPLDLGVIRVSRARVLRLRVLDPDQQPASEYEIQVTRKSSYDRLGDAFESRRRTSDSQGLVAFELAANETYVVGSTGSGFDFEPLSVDARSLSDDADTVAACISLRPARVVTIALEPSPPTGTMALIETLDGLPVVSQHVDETGLVSFNLAGSNYVMHLVEDGKVGRNVPFSINSDPFLFKVQR
jgi:hypothetical protein